ncbi:MAG: virulence RhuM family protein, partial [Candidatus Moranbacteria bacterium]|nr:virulence RhuM family protein [Candidatus Moranbacteria bacterium]
MTKELNNKIIIYSTEDGQMEIEVNLDGETIWLSQKQMAELFDKDRKTITEHIGNVFKEGELLENSVCRKFQHTALDGKTYNINHYNLDVIISVGYRVKSLRGTQFRIWATQKLREYIVKGFVMDDERLAEGGV